MQRSCGKVAICDFNLLATGSVAGRKVNVLNCVLHRKPATCYGAKPTTDSNLKSPPPWDTKSASNTNLNHCISTGSNERVSRRTIKGKITCFMIRSVPGTERQRALRPTGFRCGHFAPNYLRPLCCVRMTFNRRFNSHTRRCISTSYLFDE